MNLMEIADAVSCQAMSEMSLQEFNKNKEYNNYLLEKNTETCKRMQTLMDLTKEHDMTKGADFARKLCFIPSDTYQDGPWKDQINPYKGQVYFDKQTKRKTAPEFLVQR